MACISRFVAAILSGETELALGTARVNISPVLKVNLKFTLPFFQKAINNAPIMIIYRLYIYHIRSVFISNGRYSIANSGN